MSNRIQHSQEFEALIRANRHRLQRIARSYARRAEVDDLVQEMLLQLWRSWNDFGGRSSADTWLYRVALNTAISFARKRPAPPTTDQAEGRLGSVGDPVEPGELLVQFLDSLNEVNRSVMLLSLEGLSGPEIATVLGSSSGAVAVRLTRLRQAFEEQFVKEAS